MTDRIPHRLWHWGTCTWRTFRWAINWQPSTRSPQAAKFHYWPEENSE